MDRFDRKSAASFVFDRSYSDNSIKRTDSGRFTMVKKPSAMAEGGGGGGFMEGKVKKLCNSFEAALLKKRAETKLAIHNKLKGDDENSFSNNSSSNSMFKRALSNKLLRLNRVSSIFENRIRLPGTEEKIVVYFTSLHSIRRTYEDCYTVRMIFRGFRVPVDERDISMDIAYRKELQSVLGGKTGKTVSLPQVFIRGKHIGGAEEIKQLHEGGELVKLLKGFPLCDPRHVCEVCGDARFVPCLSCSGSRKLYCEEEGIMRRCLDCNENGLIRCPDCCH
ncbi:hypothetical protein ACHQM5_012713 [Ranunculus cassubicifolius]